MQFHPGIHVGLERFPGIVETQPRHEGAGLGVQTGIDVLHPALPGLAGQERQGHFRLVTDGYPVGLTLEYFRDQPDTGQIRQGHDIHGGFHIHSLPHRELRHHTVLGREDGHCLQHFSPFFQTGDLAAADAQGLQPLPGSADQPLVAATDRTQKLFLGIDQIR